MMERSQSSLKSAGSQTKAAPEATIDEDVDYDKYMVYRLLYHLDKFIYGWRNLLIFYLAMFIAGYAQSINSCVFWGSWTTLLLAYWEPYLSPAYSWISNTNNEASFKKCAKPWGDRHRWPFKLEVAGHRIQFREASIDVQKAMRQWLYAVQNGLQKQCYVHRIMQSCVLGPCIALIIGAAQSRSNSDVKAKYSSILLTVSTSVYALLVLTSSAVFFFGVRCKVKLLTNPDLQPKDMMFFICQILGQVLNTTVQTLVAGSFVVFMPIHLFWLCLGITAMSYTATNLLYEPDPDGVVQSEPVKETFCEHLRHHIPSKGTLENQGIGNSLSNERSRAQLLRPTHNTGRGSSADKDTQCKDASCIPKPGWLRTHRTVNKAVYTSEPASDTNITVPDVSGTRGVTDCSMEQGAETPKVAESPPFLLYKWPRGINGWAIIVILIALMFPCLAVLIIVGKGTYNKEPNLYFVDEKEDCNNLCFMRYKQMLYLLCCSGFITGYYAITVGFMGSGPVTWLYKRVYLKHCL